MIEAVFARTDNLVEIKWAETGRDKRISCEISCSVDGGDWLPAAVYPDLSGEYALGGSDFVWNQAVTMGIVRLEPRMSSVYWNAYLNIGNYTGEAKLKAVMLTEDGEYTEERTVRLDGGEVVYLNDWASYLGDDGASDPQQGEGKWKIGGGKAGPVVSMAYHEFLPPIRIPAPEGTYDVYFGVASGPVRFLVRADEGLYSRIVTPHLSLGNHAAKSDQELYWTRCRLRGGSIEIAQLRETAVSHYGFGRLSYVKLVPAKAGVPAADAPVSRPAELIMFYEPYSYSLHGFHDAETMNGVMLEEFIRIRPTEITCQTIRIGMKSLHHSKVVQKLDTPAVTDFKTTIDDPVKLAANCDILRESAAYMSGRGIRFTANIGMNRPYLWNKALSEAFVVSNPGLIKGGDFDYSEPQVLRYALAIIEEIVRDYDIDGVVFDYMRHYKNQTVESLTATIGATKAYMRDKERSTGKRMELKVRVPSDQAVYYRALAMCAANGDVDGIIPSNLLTSEPLPRIGHYVRLGRETGVRVYGCIEGLNYYLATDPRAGAVALTHSPSDIARYVETYDKLGTDGIYLYQAEELSGNPYLNKLFAD